MLQMLRLLFIMAAMAAILDHVTGYLVRIHNSGYYDNKDGGVQAVLGARKRTKAHTNTSTYNYLRWFRPQDQDQVYNIIEINSKNSIQFYIKEK